MDPFVVAMHLISSRLFALVLVSNSIRTQHSIIRNSSLRKNLFLPVHLETPTNCEDL